MKHTKRLLAILLALLLLLGLSSPAIAAQEPPVALAEDSLFDDLPEQSPIVTLLMMGPLFIFGLVVTLLGNLPASLITWPIITLAYIPLFFSVHFAILFANL